MRWLVIALLLAAAPAWAHKPSDAHAQITVSGDRLGGSLAVAVRDLDGALDLDADGDGSITWGEVLTAAPRIAAYETERLTVDGCTLRLGDGALVDFSDGAYWTVPIDGTCDGAPDRLVVTYKLLFDIDAQHRGIIQIASARVTATNVARSGNPITVELESSSAVAYAKQGLLHAFTIPQHLLVLLLLLLPLANRREALATGGAFILGCATTLAIAATGAIHLPGGLVELVLALAALAAAALNLLAIASRWELAFELGLANGLGFALWLSELSPPAHRLAPVAGFAVGLAIGLAAVTAVMAAVLSAIRVPRKIVLALSVAAAILAVIWICQIG